MTTFWEKVVYTLIGMSLIVLAVLAGCGGKAIGEAMNPTPSIEKVQASLKSGADQVTTETQKIDTSATSIGKSVPAEVKPKIESQLNQIHESSATIGAVAAMFRGLTGNLDTSKQQIAAMEKASSAKDASITKLTAANTKLQGRINSMATRALQLIIVIAGLGLGLAAMLFVQGNRYAIACAIGSGAALIVAVFAITYMTYLLLVGGILLLGAVAFGVYQIIIRHRANVELVQTGELAKQHMTPDARAAVFGVGAMSGEAGKIQSHSTELLVDKIRGVADQKILLAPPLVATPATL